MTLSRKINIPNPTVWSHHRSGWKYAAEALQDLHDPQGIKFYDWADAVFRDKQALSERWLGIFHNVISYPKEYTHKYGKGIYCLSELPNCPVWRHNMNYCRGLFTLSDHTANFLRTIVDVPVVSLIHPIQEVVDKFNLSNFQSRVVTVGQWLRRYHSIYELNTDWSRIVIKAGPWWEKDYAEMQERGSGLVSIWGYINNEEYDKMLSNSVIFLDLYDCAACNVVLECSIRNTPILVNRLPAIEQYLGSDYPLFFDDLRHASTLLNEKSITAASDFLRQRHKGTLDKNYFRDSLANSSIYKDLQMRSQILAQ